MISTLNHRRQRTPRWRLRFRRGDQWRGIAGPDRSLMMRAERAKLKSCRDDMILAQGQRGTSAALGSEREMIPSPFSGLARWPAGAPNQKKGRVSVGGLLPRAAASAAMLLGYYHAAPLGRRSGESGRRENYPSAAQRLPMQFCRARGGPSQLRPRHLCRLPFAFAWLRLSAWCR